MYEFWYGLEHNHCIVNLPYCFKASNINLKSKYPIKQYLRMNNFVVLHLS